MGVHRVELAKRGQAVCKNKECKDAQVKIQKGEFRYGTMVEIHEHQSWTWKHWGCVTPVQIANLIESSEGDTDLVDGYDELPQDCQEKVQRALKQGHVDDEDWKGDVEVNRPGQKGFRVKVPKPKKAKKGKEDAGDEEEVKPAPKKRGRQVKEEDADEEEAPPPKKARGRGKKAVKIEEDEAEEPVEAEKPAPKPRKSRAKKVSKVEEEETEPEEAEKPAPKPRKSRAKKAKEVPVEPPSDAAASPLEEPAEEPEAPPAKAKRGKKAAPKANKPAPQKRSRKAKKAAATEDEEGDE